MVFVSVVCCRHALLVTAGHAAVVVDEETGRGGCWLPGGVGCSDGWCGGKCDVQWTCAGSGCWACCSMCGWRGRHDGCWLPGGGGEASMGGVGWEVLAVS